MDRPKILIVEDDADIAELLAITFAKEGWDSLIADSGERALALSETAGLSACVLDLMLPGMDGLAVLRAIRRVEARGPEGGAGRDAQPLPIIIASARGEDPDIVTGLELGADDYIAKPFSPGVLVARLRALLRRAAAASAGHPGRGRPGDEAAGPGDAGRVELHGIALDALKHAVTVAGSAVALSATEFAVLELLMREPGRVFTRAQVIARVRGHDYPVTDRAVDVQVLGLRRKLGASGSAIETVRGIGYRFREPS